MEPNVFLGLTVFALLVWFVANMLIAHEPSIKYRRPERVERKPDQCQWCAQEYIAFRRGGIVWHELEVGPVECEAEDRT